MPELRPCISIVFSGMVMAVCGYAQSQTSTPAPRSPLWGDLHPGVYATGFRSLFRYDDSRTWKSTRSYDGAFSPDLNGRPVQINIWYPARISSLDKAMHFGDYVDQSAPERFAVLNNVMRQRNRDDAVGSIPPAGIPELQTLEMRAFRDAPPATGRFPVVLYFGGLNATINSNAIMAEYLASHGYVVASISLIGPSDEQVFQSRTSEDLEASVRDMEFAWSALQDEPNLDRTKVAVMGHSGGAVEAVILAMRNANVSALFGLDGSYGFKGLSTVLTQSYGYDPEKMRAAFLDLRRAQGAQGNQPLDMSTVESFRHADRTFIAIDKVHHSDFTSFAMVGAYFHAPLPTGYPLNGWSRESGRSGYEHVCRIVLATLEARVRADSTALARLDGEVRSTTEIIMRHENAVPPPPSPLESAAIANSGGLDAAKRAFVASCGTIPVGSCMNSGRFNTWGYNLLGQQRAKEALAVFELNAWAHPRIANMQDSLADGYAALGDKDRARQAVEQAIALAPDDPSLDPAARTSFLNDENARLNQFK